ncbi:MAG: tetratricopeptide repeat protein [Nitrospira sp.]|nr:MAG: tetratricopeptide repeat protein [Nitrospira sp.]
MAPMHYRLWIFQAVVCVVMALSVDSCNWSTPEAKKAGHRERGAAYFEKGQYQEAIIEYRNVVQLDPQDAQTHYQLALAYLKLGSVQSVYQAFDELTRTVELDKTNQDAQLKLGELFILGHEPAKARERAEIVLVSAPQNTDGLILRGRSFINERKYKEGIADLKKALDLDPKNIQTYIDLARVYFTMNDRTAAEGALNQALSINPRSLDVLLAFADFHDSTGQSERAETRYTQALETDPDNEAVSLRLASYYQRHTKLVEAEATLQQLASRKPQGDTPQIYLGDYYTATGQPAKALTSYRRATEIAPSSTMARDKLIAHYLDTGKVADAAPLVNAIREKDKHDLMGQFFDARIKLTQAKTDEAITLLQDALKSNPQFSGAHYFLGIAYLQKQQLPQARAAITDAIKFNPQFGEAHTALAQIHLTEGSPDLALEQAQAAIQLNPRNVQAATIAGTAYLHKRDLPKSRKMFEAIAQALPAEPIGPYNLGLVAQAEKNDAKALAYFEDAVAKRPTAIDPILQIVSIKNAQGKILEARERVIRQLELAPKSPPLHNLVGQLWLTTKDSAQAEKAFKTAIELDSSFLAPYLNLARSYYQAGKVDHAITEYETVLAKNPNASDALMMLGIIHNGRNEHEKARERYEHILKLNSRFAPAANNLAWLIAEQGGNLDVALAYAQTAREQRTEDPNVADTLGWIYYKKNTYLLAVSLLKEATDKLPNEPLAHYHLGMAQAKTNDATAAKHSLQTALRLSAHFPGADEARTTMERL